MNDILFQNSDIKKNFLDVIANFRLSKLEKEKSRMEDELKASVSKCEGIINDSENKDLVEKIVSIMYGETNSFDVQESNNKSTQINELFKKMTRIIDTTKANSLDAGETLDENYTTALDRIKRLKELEALELKIKAEYPNAEKVDVKEATKMSPFTDFQASIAEEVVEEDKAFDEPETKVEESRPKVVSIQSLDNDKLEKLLKGEPIKQASSAEIEEATVNSDMAFFDDQDNFKNEVEDSAKPSIEDEAPKVVTSEINDSLPSETENTEEDLISPDELGVTNFADNITSIIDEPEKEEPLKDMVYDETPISIEPVAAKEEVETIPFVLQNGMSLVTASEVAYDNQDYWNYIYTTNKEAIDKFLTSKGMTFYDGIENNTSIFEGLTINIPVYPPKEDQQEEAIAYSKVA